MNWKETTRGQYPWAGDVIDLTLLLLQRRVWQQFSQVLLCIWKLQRHSQWTAERFNGSSRHCASKCSLYIDGGSSDCWKFHKVQATDGKGQAAAQTVGHTALFYFYARCKMLIRTAPIDGALQYFVPQHHVPASYTWLTILYRKDIPGRDVRTARRNNIFIGYMWRMMCTYIYTNASHKPILPLKWRFQQELQHFSAAGPLECVSVDIFGPLPRTPTGNQHVIIIEYRFSELTWAIPAARIHPKQIRTVFLSKLVLPYGIPSCVFTNNGNKFVNNSSHLVSFFSGRDAHRNSL